MLPSGNLTFLMGKIWGKYMGNMMIYWIRINYELPSGKIRVCYGKSTHFTAG
jgi:hypothetical protein